MASTATDLLDLGAWAHTPLGDPAQWPAALRTAAQLCLAFPTSCCVLWGESSRFLYNDAMAAGIGIKHPSGMGQPLYDVLPFMWRTLGPILHEVTRAGRAFNATRFPIQVDLGDGVVQYFVDFALVPIIDGGSVRGVFSPVGNHTVTHLDGQHDATVAAVATVPQAGSRAEVAAQVVRHLVSADDVRFALVFLRDPATQTLVRAATAGAPLRPAATLAALDVAVARGLWPLEQILAERRGPQHIQGPVRAARVTRPLWEDAWLVALPGPVEGVLVLGLDARFVLPAGPAALVARLAAAVGERLGR
ncbi:hypothetical protein ACXR2U_16800 [Jatrophihabitans sp. YIM 134969]